MLFHPVSELAGVFGATADPWIGEMPNALLRRLIYVILNWKEKVADPPEGFQSLLQREVTQTEKQLPSEARSKTVDRLCELQTWHSELQRENFFSPFMSDIIGNTICSDLL